MGWGRRVGGMGYIGNVGREAEKRSAERSRGEEWFDGSQSVSQPVISRCIFMYIRVVRAMDVSTEIERLAAVIQSIRYM